MSVDQDKWNSHYRGAASAAGRASTVLLDNHHLLPAQGNALEIACGLGANAIFLARRGLLTRAWDISSVAVDQINRQARRDGLPLSAEVRDVLAEPPAAASFDVIVVTHFLDRSIVCHLIDALKVNGLLFYQTFTRSRVSNAGPVNNNFRLADNELLTLFATLRILVYREEACVGDVKLGFRDEAMLVAQKRPE